MSNSDIQNIKHCNNAFGNFISSSEQIIEPTKPIIFKNSNNILNIDFQNGSDNIKILNFGIYIINFYGQFTSSCQVALFINESPELSTLTFSNSGIISIYQILKLKKDDKISIRNYISSSSITTIKYSNGIIPESKNINLNIIQIASCDKKCNSSTDSSSDSNDSSTDSSTDSSNDSSSEDYFDDSLSESKINFQL
jgi:hypothetical protein